MNWEEIKNTLWNILVNGGWTLLKLIGIFLVGYIVIRIIKSILRKVLRKSPMDRLAKKFIYKTLVVVMYTILVVILIQVAGIPVTGLIAGLTALGLAVGLALQDSLSSLANGVILIITKPFKENDVILVNGIEGKVKSINFFTTTIDTWDNKRIIIPNKNMINYEIENINYHEKRRFSVNFKVPFGTDIKKLREVCVNAMLSHEMIYVDPKPTLWVKEITQEGIDVEARAWSISDECDVTSMEMHEILFNELKRNGFEIAQNKLIIYNEQRNKKPYYDKTPLNKRDLNKQPESKKETHLSFDDVVDGIILKPIKRKKKKNKEINENIELETIKEENDNKKNKLKNKISDDKVEEKTLKEKSNKKNKTK